MFHGWAQDPIPTTNQRHYHQLCELSTIIRCLFGKHPGSTGSPVKGIHIKKIGSPTVLTTDQEEELSDAIKITGDCGYPL